MLPVSLRWQLCRRNPLQRASSLGFVWPKISEQVGLDGAFVKPNSVLRFGLNLANYRVLPIHRNAVFAPESTQLGLWLGQRSSLVARDFLEVGADDFDIGRDALPCVTIERAVH